MKLVQNTKLPEDIFFKSKATFSFNKSYQLVQQMKMNKSKSTILN